MKIAIIGGGAAGCFAAANIQRQTGLEVVLFEKGNKLLQKVKVSGGGRCNVTHNLQDIVAMSGNYPRGERLLRKSLHQFAPASTIEWFGQRGVQIKAEADGRMFPVTDNSQTIIDCIEAAMHLNGTRVQFGKALVKLERADHQWHLHFADTTSYLCDKVLIATGGFPKAQQFEMFTALGHTIVAPVPSLFTFNLPKHPVTQLMGVALPATVRIAGTKIITNGPLLITHWGLSGPAILRASALGARVLADKQYQFLALINWLPDEDEASIAQRFVQLRSSNGKSSLYASNPFSIPKRLWHFLLESSGAVQDETWGTLHAAAQRKLMMALVRSEFQVSGKTTFKEEFVTCGGLSLSEINPQTMESRLAPGLYFAGEIMDVDGITGGFNFQHAWCSGWIAAVAIAKA